MTRFNPNRLYKDPRHGKLLGVCAGIAVYFDVRPGVIRFLAILGAVFTGFWPIVIVYIIMAVVLETKPAEMYERPEEDAFWREVRTKPDYTAADMRRRFRDIEKRTQDMEAYMTSKRFRLDRELRDLER